jgi:UPF0755 protein
MIQKLVVLLLALAVLGAIAINELRGDWAAPLTIPEQGFVLMVAPGDSLRTVIEGLYKEGVLAHPKLAILYGRWTGLDVQIKPGEYLVPQNATVESMLLLLQSGNIIQHQVTLPEGITLADALDVLAQQVQMEKVLQGPSDPRILELVKPHTYPEGLFFPDTYHFARNDTDWSILQQAHLAMNSVLQEEWDARASSLPYHTPYEALIMASIIERETGKPEEREQIAGVFVRRLQKGMHLQTDPTVIYGLGLAFQGNLQRNHLADDDNTYNTYRHPGLPPTPISLPGRAAIHAAWHPDTGNSLYFVARGDGGHVFSATLSEHNKAVKHYQLQHREGYISTPE